MNIEIERKYQVGEVGTIKERILAAGAASKGDKQSTDLYFVVPQEIEHTKYLRLRSQGQETKGVLAYHEPVDNLVANEWEVDVSDLKTTTEILQKLGYEPEITVNKNRETLELDGCEVVIDQVEGLGGFVEIEAPSKETLVALEDKLQLGQFPVIAGIGYPDLLKQKTAGS